MISTLTIVDDIVFTTASEIAQRFLVAFPDSREKVKEVIASFSEDHDLGTITVRKKPERSSTSRGKIAKNSDFESALQKTKRMRADNIVWEDVSSLEGSSKEWHDLIYSTDARLLLDENEAILACRLTNGTIQAYCIFNDEFAQRDFQKREEKLFKTFGLKIDQENVEQS